ncbi:MAG: redoxin domain-containing protein [Planctomycetes bacterium]|nr:redoxin domain-containing protein [Planctomycetota bacterium]
MLAQLTRLILLFVALQLAAPAHGQAVPSRQPSNAHHERIGLTATKVRNQTGQREFLDLNGRPHTPMSQPKKKATVLFFLLPDCPVSNSYAPEIKRICKDYEAKKVALYIVHADPDVSADMANKHAKAYGLACPVLRDPTHVLVKATGVTMAPEVALLGPDGKVRYRGRIDDIYVDYGKRRPAPTQRDLRNALDAVLLSKAILSPTTKVIGCYLPEPRK